MRIVLLVLFSATALAQTPDSDAVYVESSEFMERSQQTGMYDRHRELLNSLNSARSRVERLSANEVQFDRTLQILKADLTGGNLTTGQREYIQDLIGRLESEIAEFNEEFRVAEDDLRRQKRLWEAANDEAVALLDQIREEKRLAATRNL